ncbi:MAG: twin-arginine translocase subunit TatC [Acidobacteria bacterium]|nr:twin-arginine translocase subunit TatC [Acidobacteriota bacterium]
MSDGTTELKNKPELPQPEEDESGKMSFLEHLDELRKRLVHIAIYLFAGFVICLFFSKPIYDFISRPLTEVLPNEKLVFTKLTTPFTLYMKVAFLGGIFLTIPLTLYEVWKFIAPGLYKKEKRYVIPFLFFSVILFILGAVFCYTMVLKRAYAFLIMLGSSFDALIEVKEYLDLTNMMILGFGIIFEMPVLAAFLSMFGLINAKFLIKKFKYAILCIVILAAVISPTPDALNLVVWTIPMIALYIVSIGVAAIFDRSRKKKEAV